MACEASASNPSNEKTNYARLCRLLVDIGTQVLRDKFDAIHAPSNLHIVLAGNTTLLQSLKARKIINPTQWGKLFPAIPSSVSSATFDITLLMILLRNVCGLVSPPSGWDTLPPETDESFEAHIARIKYYRNIVFAHPDHASVDNPTFSGHWKSISDSLVRLGGVKYRAAIDLLKTESMDPESEEHYKDLLSQWKKDEDNVKDKLDNIETKITNVEKKVDDFVASSGASKQETILEGELQQLDLREQKKEPASAKSTT